MPFVVREVTWDCSSEVLTAIRTDVFVHEQGVPVELELDGLDAKSHHFLATTEKGTPVGTARLLQSGQIGRMAVLQSYRKHGIGRQLLDAAVAKAQQLKMPEIYLHAQTHALDFYAKSGFEAFGDIFDDAGIPHRAMKHSPCGASIR